jgi:hypothetical protein
MLLSWGFGPRSKIIQLYLHGILCNPINVIDCIQIIKPDSMNIGKSKRHGKIRQNIRFPAHHFITLLQYNTRRSDYDENGKGNYTYKFSIKYTGHKSEIVQVLLQPTIWAMNRVPKDLHDECQSSRQVLYHGPDSEEEKQMQDLHRHR